MASKVKVTDVKTGVEIWSGMPQEIGEDPTKSKRLIAMVEKTGMDGMTRMEAGWKAEAT